MTAQCHYLLQCSGVTQNVRAHRCVRPHPSVRTASTGSEGEYMPTGGGSRLIRAASLASCPNIFACWLACAAPKR